MKYAIITAFCCSAASAACGDPAVIKVQTYSKEGCAEADMVKSDGDTKTAIDAAVKSYND